MRVGLSMGLGVFLMTYKLHDGKHFRVHTLDLLRLKVDIIVRYTAGRWFELKMSIVQSLSITALFYIHSIEGVACGLVGIHPTGAPHPRFQAHTFVSPASRVLHLLPQSSHCPAPAPPPTTSQATSAPISPTAPALQPSRSSP